jgi:DNA (cytosine-5)-methyltransferase 1
LIPQRWPAEVAPTLNAAFGEKQGLEDQHALGGAGLFVPTVAHALRGEGFDASEDGTGRGTPLVPVAHAFDARQSDVLQYGDRTGPLDTDGHSVAVAIEDPVPPLMARSSRGGAQTLSPGHQTDGHMVAVAVAFTQNQRDEVREVGVAGALAAEPGMKQQTFLAVAPTLTAANDPSRSPQSSEVQQQVAAVHATTMQVRRLTPVECERLQGFPDGYTAIPWRGRPAGDCPDGPRYRALGNSMAVPVMRYLGERIVAVESER